MDSNDPSKNLNGGLYRPPAPIPKSARNKPLSLPRQIMAIPAVLGNPLELLRQDVFSKPHVQSSFLGQHTTTLSDPEAIRHCLVENASNYRMHPLRQIMFKRILREGLLTAEGAHWKRSRHMMSPLFAARNIENFTVSMRDTVERGLPKLLGSKRPNSSVHMGEVMTRLTYNVLSDALFSGDLSEDEEEMVRLVAVILNSLGKPDPLDILGMPSYVPRMTKTRGIRAVRKFRRMVKNTSQTRVEKIKASEAVPQDFLTLLLSQRDKEGLALTHREIEDEMVTFIGAGHETTAQALTWLLFLLSKDPESRLRVEAEVDGLDMKTLAPNDWGQKLPWTIACFEETLRLYPPASLLLRQAIDEDKFGEIIIPAGGNLSINLWVLHRHNTLWEQPNVFNPDRFYGAARNQIGRFQYLPFGAGHRTCIGAQFAMKEAAILIACLIKKFRFEYVDEIEPTPIIRLSLQPDNGMPMKVTPRGKT